MEGILMSLSLWLFGLLILIFVIRHAIDSSKTSKKLDDLINEIQLLKIEIKDKETKRKHIIDERV